MIGIKLCISCIHAFRIGALKMVTYPKMQSPRRKEGIRGSLHAKPCLAVSQSAVWSASWSLVYK